MEQRILLVSCMCLCLLTSPTLASVAIAQAVAHTAITKATAIVGAGVALKTAVIKALGSKALAGLALKAAAVKGILALKGVAAILGAKALAGLALKAAALKGVMLAKGIILGKGLLLGAAGAKVGAALHAKSALLGALKLRAPARIPTIFDIISGVVSNVQTKEAVVTTHQKMIVQEPLVYEYIANPRIYYESVPIIEEIEY